jgi:NAD-reducing hydrogenase large subunit
LIAAEPELARGGIRLRQLGQQLIAAIGGQKIHPAWCVPGGVRAPLEAEDVAWARERLPEARSVVLGALGRFKAVVEKYRDEAESFGSFSSLFMGLVDADGTWEHYDGRLRLVDGQGGIVADQLDPTRYREFIGESAERSSYVKSPYYRPLGYPDGMYRVGPLARLNVCTRMGSPLADRELVEFRKLGAGAVTSSFFYHQARLIEILTALERIEPMLNDPELRSENLRIIAGINHREGIGCSEAPRGTLFHQYEVDANGLIQGINLLIATGQNNLAMNRTVAQIARRFIRGTQISEGVLNRIEAGIRAFDPCLSCSTHAVGMMRLCVQLVGPDGTVRDEVIRD